jgi:drug/metabolite transporter (DMT)-like permease
MNKNTVKETIYDVFKHFINKKIYSIEEIKKNMIERLIKIIISNIIFYLCLLLFCNSLLFGENIIHINHIHNSLKFYEVFLIANFAVLITILLFMPLKGLITISDIIYFLIKGIMDKKKLNDILINYIKNTKTRIFIYYFIEFILIAFIFYYVTVFCSLYYHSVGSMFYCYITGIILTIIYLSIFAIIYYLINKNINFKTENPLLSIYQILKN